MICAGTNAIVEPYTVMVKTVNALVARPAMFGLVTHLRINTRAKEVIRPEWISDESIITTPHFCESAQLMSITSDCA